MHCLAIYAIVGEAMKDFRGQDFTRQFAKIQFRARIVFIIGILDFIFLGVCGSRQSHQISEDSHMSSYEKGGLILWLGIMAFYGIYWRCPACRAGLGRGMGPNFCETCGAMLDWPEGNEPFCTDTDPKCGQCGITLRKGHDGCHWCGWKPAPVELLQKTEVTEQ